MDARKATILVVDDSSEVLSVFEILSEIEGFELVTAQNGLEGLEVFEQMMSPPDIVFVDLIMPIMDGQQFLNELANRFQEFCIPTVVMSAKQNELRHPFIRQTLSKPFRLDEIRGILRSVLETAPSAGVTT